MSSTLALALNTELTSIPTALQNFLGPHFNNSLCNGVTWLVLFWLGLHICYSKVLNILLKQWGLSECLRLRLGNSLWMLSFYTACLAVFTLTWKNEVFSTIRDLEKFKTNVTSRKDNVPEHEVLAYALLCSFNLFTCYVQGRYWGSILVCLKYLSLSVVCISAYTCGLIDIPFMMAPLLALSGILEEISRLCYFFCSLQSGFSKLLLHSALAANLLIFCLVLFLIVPWLFILPLGAKVLSEEPDGILVFLFVSLITWIHLAAYKSGLGNLAIHWLHHTKSHQVKQDEPVEEEHSSINGCLGNTIECSLFPPRNDFAYFIALMRSEVKGRQKEMVARRKPKNQNVIIQTLKCMMLIKRKLSEKKEGQATSSDEDDQQLISEHFDDESDDNGVVNDVDNDQLPKVKRCDKLLRFSDGEANDMKESSENPPTETEADDNEAELKSVDLESKTTSEVAQEIVEGICRKATLDGGDLKPYQEKQGKEGAVIRSCPVASTCRKGEHSKIE